MGDWQKIGEVSFHSDAYGQAMSELNDCLKEVGFKFNHDPLKNTADLEMKVNNGGEE